MVDFVVNYEYLTGSITQLFFSIFALVAGCFLLKSKEIGGIIGIAYAILTASDTLLVAQELSVYWIIFDVSLSIAIIILIVIGWKHLKHP